jgi:chromosome partitioning protein
MRSRVITVAQQKGGAGKTTLAAHLAIAWHREGETVAVVDIDPQGSLSQWFSVRQDMLGKAGAGLTVAAVTGWRAMGEIERMARDHSLIVVDSPPHAQTEAKMAIRGAHLVVIPVQPSPLDLWATKPTVDIARDERIPAMLVLNRVPIRNPMTEELERILSTLDVPVAATRIGNRAALSASMAEGKAVFEAAPNTQAAREMTKLARELLTLVQKKK